MARRGAKRRWRWIAPIPLALLSVVFLVDGSAQAQSPYWPNGECVQVGAFFSDSSTLAGTEAQLGVRFDEVLKFQPVQDLDLSKLTPFMDAGVRVILNIEFEDDHPNLRDIVAGKYDSYLTAFSHAVATDGRQLWIRPLHEGNGNWYPWGVYADPNATPALYIDAFQHVVNVLRAGGGRFKFEFDINQYDGLNKTTPLKDFYPGDSYVDMNVITTYNRDGTDKYHTTWETFRGNFTDAYTQVKDMSSRPIGIAEMSSTSYGGDKAQWITDAFAAIASTDFKRVVEVTWFDENKTVDGVLWDWALNTPAEIAAFQAGVAQLRSQAVCANRLVMSSS